MIIQELLKQRSQAVELHQYPKVNTSPQCWQVMWLVVTKVRSKSFRLVTQRCHCMRLLCAFSHMFAYWTFPVSVHLTFSSLSVVSHAFSVLRASYAHVQCSGIILIP